MTSALAVIDRTEGVIPRAIRKAVHIEAVRRVRAGEKTVVMICPHNNHEPRQFTVKRIIQGEIDYAIGFDPQDGARYAMELS